VVEQMPSKHKALGSVLSSEKKTKNKKQKTKNKKQKINKPKKNQTNKEILSPKMHRHREELWHFSRIMN